MLQTYCMKTLVKKNNKRSVAYIRSFSSSEMHFYDDINLITDTPTGICNVLVLCFDNCNVQTSLKVPF